MKLVRKGAGSSRTVHLDLEREEGAEAEAQCTWEVYQEKTLETGRRWRRSSGGMVDRWIGTVCGFLVIEH